MSRSTSPTTIWFARFTPNPDVRFAHVTFIDPNDSNNTVNTLEGISETGDYSANVTVGVSE